MRRFLLVFLLAALFVPFSPVESAEAARVAVSLKGSPESMNRQHGVAETLGYAFIEEADEVARLLEERKLVELPGNAHYRVLESVSYPVARPELRLFLERLARQYYEGTGEQLVVTSLLRPEDEQPWNSHPLSVHPAGVAVDLRVSKNARARRWLESVLLKLEGWSLLDATRERRPPHYHIALFPDAYREHVAELIGEDELLAAMDWDAVEDAHADPSEEGSVARASEPEGHSLIAASTVPVANSGEREWPYELPLAVVVALAIGYLVGQRQALRQGRDA